MQWEICHGDFRLPFRPRRYIVCHGIELYGDAEFCRRTQAALALLQPLAQFETIRAHLGIIRQGKRSGMKAWAAKPTFVVGRPTWSHSVLWYAGAVAHDAYHAALYSAAKKRGAGKEPPAASWTGAAAERQCLAFQREMLIALNADEKLIDYLDRCARNPTYQGHHQGWRSWLDYHKRRW